MKISQGSQREFLLKAFIFLLFLSNFGLSLNAQVYTESYRPQFHVSPTFGFMGDPNGTVKYKDKYHLFWWGHLRSDDLVHWEQLNTNALNGTPGGYGNWSGCVVVDEQNTAGFNSTEDTAMIAIYTLHHNPTNVQQQAISISLNHVSFQYFSGNPVIPNNGPDFRDPQVFWYQPTARWIMVVTKPVDRVIEIFSSDNLKNWTKESTFSDRGAKREVWEVPDLFPLLLNDNPSSVKWVMTCGMGPNRMQYWVGDFNGSTFTVDPNDNLISGKHVRGELFSNFENGFGNWTVEGTAFGSEPASGTLVNQQPVNGFTGFGYLNSFHEGDISTGKITSPNFLIEKRYINFQIGGGSLSNVGLNIVVDNQVVETIQNTSNSERMQWRGIDVSQHIGKSARLEIVDNATGSWGHILVDHIVFSNVQYDSRVENANWMDWGFDFYAHKTFRDYDESEDRTVGLAWMGNWAYAQNVPTTPWKGCQSIPKELKLIEQGNGYELIQKPVEELQSIRQEAFSQSEFIVNEGTQPLAFDPIRNVFELKTSFLVENENQRFGLNLAEGANQKIVVTYDAKSSSLTIDRTDTPFNYAFRRVEKMPVYLSDDGILDLHIFVDQSSIEVFSEGYKYNFTALAFNDASSHAISLFSENGSVKVQNLEAWRLQSIWGVPTSDEEPLLDEEPRLEISPNPVENQLRLSTGKESYEPIVICIFDLNGRLYLQKEQIQPLDSVEVADLPPGLYFLQITSNANTIVRKFVKQ
jgi:sucrose-6-phosphate hydrolase SacC (GH32 family)